MSELTPLAFTKQILNSQPLDSMIARRDIKNEYRKTMGHLNGLTTVYTYLSKLLIAGYLQAAQSPGFYRIVKHLESSLTYDDLNSMYSKNRSFVREIATERPDGRQVGGSHYVSLPYQPVALACKIGLTFVQGNIVKYITRHRTKNGLQDIEKAKHYAELAIIHNCFGDSNQTSMREIYRYCSENNIPAKESNIIRLAADNKYKAVIALCDELIDEYKQKLQ